MTQMTWWLKLCVNSGRNSHQRKHDVHDLAPQPSAGVLGHAHLTWPQSSLVASAEILVHAPFHPCQVAVTPFGDWMISTGAQFLAGLCCVWPGWLGASLQWLGGPSSGHQREIIVLLLMSLYPYHALLFVLLPVLMFEYIYDVTTAINIILTWLHLSTAEFPEYCQGRNMSWPLSNTCCVQTQLPHIDLTHWGRVTHICVSDLTIIGSDNGLSPGRRQAII